MTFFSRKRTGACSSYSSFNAHWPTIEVIELRRHFSTCLFQQCILRSSYRPFQDVMRVRRHLTLAARRLSSTVAPTGGRALVLNAGSSSIKYGLFDIGAGGGTALCSGLVEKIGVAGASITHKAADGTKQVMSNDGLLTDHGVALAQVVELLTSNGGPISNVADIDVVGHRVVHGGATLTAPTIVDEAVEKSIEACVPLAPLHNPANLLGIRVAQSIFAPAPHVAIFDTAFHATMPPESYTYALPRELAEAHGVRRYGFHGTSYTYVLQQVALMNRTPLCVIACSPATLFMHVRPAAGCGLARNGEERDECHHLPPRQRSEHGGNPQGKVRRHDHGADAS